MICFQISIFEPLETAKVCKGYAGILLWFAFKLVSLNHWKQLKEEYLHVCDVVICFQISIFEPLETAVDLVHDEMEQLWFAFKLVSLNHWKQRHCQQPLALYVVICFQISIFEPLETASYRTVSDALLLWFAFKLVSLNHWKQQGISRRLHHTSCDLLSN